MAPRTDAGAAASREQRPAVVRYYRMRGKLAGFAGRCGAMHDQITPDDLQDYIEGRLSPNNEARVEAYLRLNPAEAAHVELLRQQARYLRKLGEDIVQEPVPDHLLELVRRLPK
jgi:hypothetical protein